MYLWRNRLWNSLRTVSLMNLRKVNNIISHFVFFFTTMHAATHRDIWYAQSYNAWNLLSLFLYLTVRVFENYILVPALWCSIFCQQGILTDDAVSLTLGLQ